MKAACLFCVAALYAATAASAETFDGSAPMLCEPLQGHDCLPTEKSCKPIEPEPGKDLTMHFDVQKMRVRTPYQYETLPIQSFAYNRASLVMQGTSLELVWSATIHRTTGRLTIAIADRQGAHVIFGQCRLAGAATQEKSG